jgi:hypothetical protein
MAEPEVSVTLSNARTEMLSSDPYQNEEQFYQSSLRLL